MKPKRWLATCDPRTGTNLWPKVWVEWSQRTNGYRGVASFSPDSDTKLYHRVSVVVSRPVGTISVFVDPSEYCSLLSTSIQASSMNIRDLQWITVWLQASLTAWHAAHHEGRRRYSTPIDFSYLDGDAEVIELSE